MTDAPFISAGFEPPSGLSAPTFVLEPLGPQHNERDYAAWTSSFDHNHATPGFVGSTWPHEMTLEENRADLERHERDFAGRTGTIAFDATRMGGDGAYEFFTVGVDKAGNREAPPEDAGAIAGDGPNRNALEQRAATLGVSERIRFLGHRNDVPALLAAADLFVLPSLYEGLPLAVLEAMASGVPNRSSAWAAANAGISSSPASPGSTSSSRWSPSTRRPWVCASMRSSSIPISRMVYALERSALRRCVQRNWSSS